MNEKTMLVLRTLNGSLELERPTLVSFRVLSMSVGIDRVELDLILNKLENLGYLSQSVYQGHDGFRIELHAKGRAFVEASVI